MKLYFSPGACSLSPHIVAREAGLDVALERVDLGAKKTASGQDFWQINPKGYVPALQLDDGSVLSEGVAIVQFLADKNPGSKLAPAAGTPERYRLQEWLTFLSSEVHKNFSPLFNPKLSPEMREMVTATLSKRLDYVAKHLTGKTFLMGDTFSVADAYLFTVLSWTGFLKIDLGQWPALQQFVERVRARPAVQAALAAEKGEPAGDKKS